MSTNVSDVALVCPGCGSDSPGHLETVTVRYRGKATLSLQEGRSYEYLTDYDSDRFDESATAHQITPFECLDCGSQYELEDLDVPDSITGRIDGWSRRPQQRSRGAAPRSRVTSTPKSQAR